MMNIAKRVFLYLITNILVVATVSLIINVLGLHSYLTHHGIDYQALAAICLIWGMGSSMIALLISRWMAKVAMSVQLVDASTSVPQERQLIQKVYHLARRVGLHTMPQVGIYKANELNAFATGPSKNRALVAVSSGLLNTMSADELEGVLAHEISHVANGDMVTMTLVQGVVNAFSLFLSRIMAYALRVLWSRSDDRNRYSGSAMLYMLSFIFDILLTLFGSLVVAAFSRYREYRADKGGARLVGRQNMIAALECLRTVTMPAQQEEGIGVIAPLQINRRYRKNGFFSLLASHPDIDLRIAALRV
jgi:heat shock protein HtpX